MQASPSYRIFEGEFSPLEDSFLYKVAGQLLNDSGISLPDCHIIFPNKRPEYYFRKALAMQAKEAFISPQISSIEEFIGRHSDLKVLDPLEQLFILYEIYSRYLPEEFDAFHNWGNMLLRDYDEIDRNLIDTGRFFKNLSAAKELDETQPDEAEALLFWSTISRSDLTQLQGAFLKHWDIFERVYFDFSSYLEQSGNAYAGMQYRQAAIRIRNREYDTGKFYIFIGFNALSKAEESIIRSLLKDKRAKVLFDIDSYYFDNPSEEAGHFVRKSVRNLHIDKPQVISCRLTEEEKTIHISGISLEVAQAKVLGATLNDFLLTAKGSTAIIMPDENMILPVLHALPETVGEVNFTAGYPLVFTSLFTLFENLSSLQENFDPGLQSFYYKDVLAILSHPYLHCRGENDIKMLIEDIEERQTIYIHHKRLQSDSSCEILSIIFEPIKKTSALINYLEKILSDLDKNTFSKFHFSDHFIDIFYSILGNLKSFLFRQGFEVSIPAFWKFFRQQAGQIKIPLQEDKPEALQIMGMLETRCLNFDNIFILNVNEGDLPSSRNAHSYIPFDIRKAFGLPVSEEQETLYAYYFYRLIQGAKNIHLFYNTETGTGGAEKSRYIRQIEYYLKKRNPKIRIKNYSYTIPLKNYQPQEITLKKDEYFYEALTEKSQKDGISPTFISSYYVCPLQFLLNYVLKLKPKEEITEDLEADRFGTLFHAVMEKIYEEFANQEVTAEMLRIQRARIEHFMRESLKELRWDADYYTNKNSLLLETIKVLVNKALDADEAYAPFFVLGLEKKLKHTLEVDSAKGKTIQLQGTIDRIDEKNGTVRIVDYKTGNVQKFFFNYNDAEENLTKYNKEAFQTLFYGYLFHKNTGRSNLQPTILPLKKVSEGYQQVNGKNGLLQEENFAEFEIKLKEIIGNILDKKQDIKQIDDLNICSVCNYNTICLR